MQSTGSGGSGGASAGGAGGGGGAGAVALPEQLRKLVELIVMHNPYTDGEPTDMDFLLYPPTGNDAEYSQFKVEVESGYPEEWNFKGQPQKINKILRIQYRAKAKAKDGYGNARKNEKDYWMTAYLLIGFEDGSA